MLKVYPFYVSIFQLADHSNFQNIQSEHVMVCAKMRAKLVSEVRQNIDKLKVRIFIFLNLVFIFILFVTWLILCRKFQKNA